MPVSLKTNYIYMDSVNHVDKIEISMVGGGGGGGVMIYIRKDIPTKELKNHNFTKNVEAIFVYENSTELNMRKSKLLLCSRLFHLLLNRRLCLLLIAHASIMLTIFRYLSKVSIPFKYHILLL